MGRYFGSPLSIVVWKCGRHELVIGARGGYGLLKGPTERTPRQPTPRSSRSTMTYNPLDWVANSLTSGRLMSHATYVYFVVPVWIVSGTCFLFAF